MSEAELVAEIKTLRNRVKTLEDSGSSDEVVKKLEAKIESLEKKIEFQTVTPIDWDA